MFQFVIKIFCSRYLNVFIIKYTLLRFNYQNMRQNQSVLIFGATGFSGFNIAITMLKEGYRVLIFVRSKQKAARMFKQKTQQFKQIIQGKIQDYQKVNYALNLLKKQKKNRNNSKAYVISALGARPQNKKQQVKNIEYLSQMSIVDLCQKYSVDKYVLVSAALIQRPWHPFAVFLNTIISDVFHWKGLAQNYIRQSSLKYIVVRPTMLIGELQEQQKTSYRIGQGDTLMGQINRKTLSYVILDSLQTHDIPDRVTFECSSSKSQQSEQFGVLNCDNEDNIIEASHKSAKYIYWVLLLCILVSIIGLVAFFIIK